MSPNGYIYRHDQIIAVLAAAAHMANRAYCIALGDVSQPVWEVAPEWARVSAIKGVEAALKGATPRESHEGWLAEKVATGWKYGQIKNTETKEHPCMVPYDELPPEQRLKDAIFLTTIRSLALVLGIDGGA